MESGVSTIEFLSVGDLIGQAVRLYWRKVLMILQVLLVPAIGCMVGKLCMYSPFTLFFKPKSSLFESGAIPDFSLLAIACICALGGFIILLYSLWVMMLRLFALMKLFVVENNQDHGESFDKAYKKAYQVIKSMQGAILAVFTVSTMIILVAAVAWTLIIIVTALVTGLHVVPGWVIAGFIMVEILSMLVSIILISIIYWLALNEIILADSQIQPAVSQAWLLAWPNFWRVLFFIFLGMLVTILLTWPLALPMWALSVAEIFFKDGQQLSGPDFASHLQDALISYGNNVPFYRIVLAQASGTIISMITWPIMYFAWALFYQDLKKRALAPDLLHQLQAIIGAGE